MAGNKPPYLIDSDVLIHIRHRPDSDQIYAALGRAVEEGWLRTVRQVPDEVKRWPVPHAGIAPYKNKMVIPAAQQFTEEVKAVNETVQNLAPFLFEQAGGRNPDPADPWLIAVAKVHGYTLVTNENEMSTVRIPHVCRLPEIKCDCMNGAHFLLETKIVETLEFSQVSPHAFFAIPGRGLRPIPQV